MQPPVEAILSACHPVARRDTLRLADLVALADAIALDEGQIDALRCEDPAHPYGRRVLMAEPRLEVMVATWTPDFPCIPHDHGGQSGVVRVLRGASLHRIWHIADNEATCIKEHTAERDEILACGPDLIHSMGCAGAGEGLVTLHLYTDAIPHMIVYDLPREETLVVSGYCGAWVPEPGSDQIVARMPGLRDRAEVSAWMAARAGSAPADG